MAKTKLTPPKSKYIGFVKDEAEAEAQRIIKNGGLAWVREERGNDMGVQDAFWGYRVMYFQAGDLRRRLKAVGKLREDV